MKQYSITEPKEKEGLIDKFTEIAKREGKDRSELILELLADYIKKHGAGNPAFTLDEFKDPDFRICPALWNNIDNWNKYLHACSKQELENLETRFTILKGKAVAEWRIKNA